MMKKLIITADDYGMSESVNEAIKQCIKAGTILSTNVMTNMDYAEKAKELVGLRDGLSIGLHWNLTAGKPVLPSKEVSTLIDSDGFFLNAAVLRKRYIIGKAAKQQIKKELVAQYKEFVHICGEPDYWNTHQNIHVNFGLFKLFVDVAVELGVNRMRCHNRIRVSEDAGKSKKDGLSRTVKSYIVEHWNRYARKKGMLMPDGVLVFIDQSDRYSFKSACSRIIWDKGDGIAEMYVHPATDGNCVYFGKITEGRVKEYKMCNDAELRGSLAKHNIEIVNFSLVR